MTTKVLDDVRSLYRRIPGIGLEHYYRDIETREKLSGFAKTANKPKDWLRRRTNLEELIRRVVVQTTCQSENGRLRPRSSSAHTTILKNLKKGDSILTFNYDMLIEESFDSDAVWTPRGGYGKDVYGLSSEWCKKWFKARNMDHQTESKVRLIKLHGSVNWRLYRTKKVRLKDRPFVVRTGDFENVSIMPPGPNKRIDRNPYRQLWREGRLRLEKAKTIIIIGYSLPEADILARALFAEVVRLRRARNEYIKQLHLADPLDSVKERFVDLFVPALNAQSKVYRYSGIDEFAKRVRDSG